MDNSSTAKMIKNKLRSFLTATILVVSFVALVFSNLVDTAKISFPISVIISIIVMVLSLFLILLYAKQISFGQGLIFLTLCAFYVVSYLFHMSGFEYLINIIAITSIIILLPKLDCNKKSFKVLPIIYFIYVILVMAFAPKHSGVVSNSVVSFKNMNPNISSILLMVFTVYLLKLLSETESKHKKITLIALIILSFYFQIDFSSRIAIIGSVFAVIYYLFRKKLNRIKSNKITVFVLIVFLFSPIFCYFYSVTLFDFIGKGNLIIMGKDIFTGRQVIWSEAFLFIENDLFLGVGNVFKSTFYPNEVTATNLHNQMMGCLVCFGVVNMILFAFSYSVGVGVIWKTQGFQFSATLLLILTIISYTETVFYSSNIIYVVIFGLLMTSNTSAGEINDKEDSLRMDRE